MKRLTLIILGVLLCTPLYSDMNTYIAGISGGEQIIGLQDTLDSGISYETLAIGIFITTPAGGPYTLKRFGINLQGIHWSTRGAKFCLYPTGGDQNPSGATLSEALTVTLSGTGAVEYDAIGTTELTGSTEYFLGYITNNVDNDVYYRSEGATGWTFGKMTVNYADAFAATGLATSNTADRAVSLWIVIE